ncbi:type II toxin-antitoxin system HicB family antitoxin [Desulfovibrio sp. X2]|uniref:type II toxin-antitoxin system HicB family antitoxin n=1 Tax=Desulfovibrio sp. X2 TaxID=941449 RepID=UPI000A06215F|nr:type II toxin-antitoxin system HicB family antitoxin [Desulfovibrio sp. X2]
MELLSYGAAFVPVGDHRESPEKGTYRVIFPDLEKCGSVLAKSLGEAEQKAQKALSACLAEMRAKGEHIPKPRTMDEIVAQEERQYPRGTIFRSIDEKAK